MAAVQAINEYVLVKRGGLSYQELGYATWDGSIPATKVGTHLFIHRIVERERAAKANKK